MELGRAGWDSGALNRRIGPSGALAGYWLWADGWRASCRASSGRGAAGRARCFRQGVAGQESCCCSFRIGSPRDQMGHAAGSDRDRRYEARSECATTRGRRRSGIAAGFPQRPSRASACPCAMGRSGASGRFAFRPCAQSGAVARRGLPRAASPLPVLASGIHQELAAVIEVAHGARHDPLAGHHQ